MSKEAEEYFNESDFVTSEFIKFTHNTVGTNTSKLFEIMESYHQHRLEKDMPSDEEIFNAGFDEGYTSPMEINGKAINEGQYERGRKSNYNQWVKEKSKKH